MQKLLRLSSSPHPIHSYPWSHLMQYLALVALILSQQQTEKPDRLAYPGKEESSAKVVLIAGDEEYRSEEALPQLAKILSKQHGFKTVVLFPIDPKNGTINPNVNNNIPGLEELRNADLMILALRFRNLPDKQMKEIADYLDSGRPIIALRTSTHAFNMSKESKYAYWSWNNSGRWKGGFGKEILGETWVSHHGHHGKESTLGLFGPGKETHPVLKGIKTGEIWGPTDVYGVTLPKDADTLVLGQVLSGMTKETKPVKGEKNEPMMPVVWTRAVKSSSGKVAKVLTTTMGASQDLENEAFRRLLVNGTYWSLDKEIPDSVKVDIEGSYKPSKFSFNGFVREKKPSDYR